LMRLVRTWRRWGIPTRRCRLLERGDEPGDFWDTMIGLGTEEEWTSVFCGDGVDVPFRIESGAAVKRPVETPEQTP
jgi:hypothetical protein